ncbi:DUF6710 family protein [Streptococcus ferus]|uniref:DUF6710 family protein n=1 Tax=Streptococcus ferus TaxID=1345 RepID=UPI00235485B5|nr:DUF6710 family protein [Streptococcus ferus]
MNFIEKIKNISKYGKTNTILNEKRLSIKREVEIQTEKNREVLETHIRNVRSYLASKDFNAVNKYVHLLTQLENFEIARINLEIDKDYSYHADNGFNIFDSVKTSLKDDHDIDIDFVTIYYNVHEKNASFYLRRGDIPIVGTPVPTFTIREIPILLNIWNKESIAKRIASINNKNILRPDINIYNHYIYPLGIFVCICGNHSQFGAFLDNASGHMTTMNKLLDVSSLYNLVYFDGTYFRLNGSDSKVCLAIDRTSKLLGILFEIGRLLKEYPAYYPSVVSDSLQK